MRAHSALALTLLHQPTEGEQWKEGKGEGERKTLPYFSVPERHGVSVWCERQEGGREEGWGKRRVVMVGCSMQAGVITYMDSGAVLKACYIRQFPGSAQLRKLCEEGGKTHQ